MTTASRGRAIRAPSASPRSPRCCARQAFEIGADWVVPFDADEFWWCRHDKSLRAFLDDAGGAPAFLAPVVNFGQHRRRRRSSWRGLLHLRMRAIPVPPAEDARRLVTDREIGFVEMLYPPKAIFRAGSDVVVPTGNHVVVGTSGPPVETNDLAGLHAPLRSKQVLEAQAEHGRRVREVSSDPQTAWHARRWLDLSGVATSKSEWRANSYLDEALDVYGQRHVVEPDGVRVLRSARCSDVTRSARCTARKAVSPRTPSGCARSLGPSAGQRPRPVVHPVGVPERDGAEQPPPIGDPEAARESGLATEGAEEAGAQAGIDRAEEYGHDGKCGVAEPVGHGPLRQRRAGGRTCPIRRSGMHTRRGRQ